MGYRMHWYKLKKGEDFSKNKSELIFDNMATVPVRKLLDTEDFTKHCTKLNIDGEDCYIINKEAVKMIILEIRSFIITCLKENIDIGDCDNKTANSIRYHALKQELASWENPYSDYGFNINLDEDDKVQVSGSNDFKYCIFDVIALYKFFDWENYNLILYGW